MGSLPDGAVILSPLDQLADRMYMTFFLVFKTPDPELALKSLQTGLERLNRRLNHLRGHVVLGPRGRLVLRVEPPDTAVKLEELSPARAKVLSNVTFAQLEAENAPLRRFPPSLCPQPLFVPIGPDTEVPALALNYACMDGGLVVGVSPQHNVFDGAGAAELVRLWAHFTRTESDDVDEFSTPGSSEHAARDVLLRANQSHESKTRAAKGQEAYFQELLAKHPEYALRSGKGIAAKSSGVVGGTSKIFRFDVNKLQSVKHGLEMHDPPPNMSMRLTTNSILSAILWSCITRVRAARRGPDFPVESKLGFAVDVRRHVGLSQQTKPYLGNAVCLGRAAAAADDLVKAAPSSNGLGALVAVVEAVADAVMRVTPEGVEEVMDMAEGAPDVGGFVPGWDGFNGPDLAMTSWANLKLYEADFGEAVGKPRFVRVPEGRSDGVVVVLPRKEEERIEGGAGGSIEVAVILNAEDLAALEKDEAWTSCLASEA